MSAPKETRRVQRIPVKIPAVVSIASCMGNDFVLTQKEMRVLLIEMSSEGISLIGRVYIPEGVILIIEFARQFIRHKEQKELGKVRLTGEVMSSRMMGGQYRLGILIKEITNEDKTDIIEFIK